MTAFIAHTAPDPDPETVLRMPEHPIDEQMLEAAFGNFGMPDHLD